MKQNISARTLGQQETRGADGRGFQGAGFDHGTNFYIVLFGLVKKVN